eukprot:TRINITY_DN2887_c0_g1_i1.p1 TRINITY_DN2887_c0_g1~~TRINITY_DN2887_c0_g1_i1.p1  ORF type:complete len:681 (+),score=53.26 TRINITY_DN2887_c0_g1_i1:284-2326(+)
MKLLKMLKRQSYCLCYMLVILISSGQMQMQKEESDLEEDIKQVSASNGEGLSLADGFTGFFESSYFQDQIAALDDVLDRIPHVQDHYYQNGEDNISLITGTAQQTDDQGYLSDLQTITNATTQQSIMHSLNFAPPLLEPQNSSYEDTLVLNMSYSDFYDSAADPEQYGTYNTWQYAQQQTQQQEPFYTVNVPNISSKDPIPLQQSTPGFEGNLPALHSPLAFSVASSAGQVSYLQRFFDAIGNGSDSYFQDQEILTDIWNSILADVEDDYDSFYEDENDVKSESEPKFIIIPIMEDFVEQDLEEAPQQQSHFQQSQQQFFGEQNQFGVGPQEEATENVNQEREVVINKQHQEQQAQQQQIAEQDGIISFPPNIAELFGIQRSIGFLPEDILEGPQSEQLNVDVQYNESQMYTKKEEDDAERVQIRFNAEIIIQRGPWKSAMSSKDAQLQTDCVEYLTNGRDQLAVDEGVKLYAPNGDAYVIVPNAEECAIACEVMVKRCGQTCCDSFSYHQEKKECYLKQGGSRFSSIQSQDGWQSFWRMSELESNLHENSIGAVLVCPQDLQVSFYDSAYISRGYSQLAVNEGIKIPTKDRAEFKQEISIQDCAMECEKIDECDSFSYSIDYRLCYLKTQGQRFNTTTNTDGWSTYWRTDELVAHQNCAKPGWFCIYCGGNYGKTCREY